jgi:membrane-bound lytic murein transglycosylase B
MTRTMHLPWRRVAAGVPALALIGSGVALAASGGHPATAAVNDAAPVVTVPPTALSRPDAPVLPALPSLPAPPEQSATFEGTSGIPSALPASMSANGIPALALAAYQRAAALVDAADSACRIDWALVAAIGKVESDHGRYGGNGIDRDGTVRPGIYGIPLNGTNETAVIHDTDAGILDRDQAWDRAVGPMQFIPGTWRTVGVDANGDGRKDPQNITDAATATAVYLCSGPGDLSSDSGARSAVLRYNQSAAYADQVLAIAAGYRGGYTVVPEADLSAAQRGGAPYLPSGDDQTMAHYDAAAAAKPAGGPTPASSPTTARSGRSGSGGSSSGTGSTAGATPTASGTSGAGLTDVVGGVVSGVVRGAAGGPGTSTATAPTPTTPSGTQSPEPTSTTALPAQVLPVGGTCPAGYDPVLNLLGVTVLCVLPK